MESLVTKNKKNNFNINIFMSKQEELKKQILELTAQYYAEVHDPAKKEFVPGESFVHYGGRVFDEQEMKNLIDSSLDFG